MVAWYHNYLIHRNMSLELRDHKHRATVSLGFPQGRVALARFWLIAFDRTVSIINSHDIFGIAFADDCAALIGGKHIDELLAKMQNMLDDLAAWGHTCGLHFNPEKNSSSTFYPQTNGTRKVP